MIGNPGGENRSRPPEIMNAPITPSKHQQAVIKWACEGRQHAVIEAVAGSGKSTLLEMLIPHLRGSVMAVSFGSEIARALGQRFKDAGHPTTRVVARTCNSVGFGAVRFAFGFDRVEMAKSKYREIVNAMQREIRTSDKLCGNRLDEADVMAIAEAGFPYIETLKLIDHARTSLSNLTSESLFEICVAQSITIEPAVEAICYRMVREALAMGKDQVHGIDFIDQLWLPVVLDLKPKRYSWILVDECQDLSPLQYELVKRCLAPGGRMIWVGDRKQAIYAFAGADAHSFQRIIDDMQPTLLPLSVCYRCAKSIVAVAQPMCSQIEADPNAPEGIVRSIDGDELYGQVKPGAMLLCRVNAPLLGICYRLLGNGVAASVRGRDIGAGLTVAIDAVMVHAIDFGDFKEAINTWEEDAADRINARGGREEVIHSRLESLHDKAECLRIMYASSKPKSPDELKASITSLFDNGDPSVVLSSIHKAKGLEEHTVFIIEPDRLRKPFAKNAVQMEQEGNLFYVAVTRAKRELVFVEKTGTGYTAEEQRSAFY